ncbi:2-oxo-4-hydroxy-4-carboxy-5-ureidoimidazoline decarboxylase [Thermoleptolyngbya sp. C42_A2020_037]|uniref:2-oxo-4-hydroxy-4-carboxy-5-ureidoimidazoline decarboxylase n=1 Tax=Thermoleptolyngbya sp. C42_A2020_037 TaxID=2747799 RepID=UPI0025E04B7E|nr:2-oxo-4-hydroxy-4-carboxy-5-ureidoimidazoline decarboxylase [Thermoleptolyngbya sp. C42_A2020_037]
MLSLSELNAMSQEAFVAALGAIFENTPAIAAKAWHQRPFDSVEALHRAMVAVVQADSDDAQLALLRAHPDLGSRAAMADASVQEQASAGLDRLSPEEYSRFHQLNQAYTERFGFPFIIAVRSHTKASILAAFEERLQNSRESERQTALQEVFKIARFRLDATLSAEV